MTRDEAVQKFRSGEAKEIFQRAIQKSREELVEKRDAFAQALRDAFWKMMEKAKEYPDFKVREIQFSYLQVHVMDGTYKWLAELHDEKGEFVSVDISESLDMKRFFETYEAYRPEVYQEASKYVSTLTPADCDSLMVENFRELAPYFYFLGVYAFRGINEDARFQEIPIHKVFRILIGGRREKAFLVFYKLEKPEEAADIKEKLNKEATEQDYSNDDFSLFDFSDEKFEDNNLSMRNFPFTCFRRAIFDKIEMYGSKCLLSDWHEAKITNCFFDGSCFNGADFSDAYFENVSLLGARFDVASDMKDIPFNPTIIPVSFRNATLKNVDFRGTFLAGCDFSGAKIGRINFAEADMKDAKLPMEYRDELELSEEQKKDIHWVKD